MFNRLKKILFLVASFIFIPTIGYALSVYLPVQGGTGIGTVASSDLGSVLVVSSTSPFQYKLMATSSLGIVSSPSGTSTQVAYFGADSKLTSEDGLTWLGDQLNITDVLNIRGSTSTALITGVQDEIFGNILDLSASSTGAGLSMDWSGRLLAENTAGTSFAADNGGAYVGGATALKLGWSRATGDTPLTYFQDVFYQPSIALEDLDTYVSGTLAMRIRNTTRNGIPLTSSAFILSNTSYTEAAAVATSYGLQVHTTQPYGLAVVASTSTVNAPLLVLRDDAYSYVNPDDGTTEWSELSWSGSAVINGQARGLPVLISAYKYPFGLGSWSRLQMYFATTTDTRVCIGEDCIDPQSMLDVRGGLIVDSTSTFKGVVSTTQPIFLGTNPTVGSFQEGKLYYDNVYKTLSLNVDTDVNLQMNQETVVRVVNNSASNILNGQVVYATGASGEFPTVALADASDLNKSYILGSATQDILIGAEGFVTVRGIIHDLNTNAFTAGDNLYLSTTTPGGLVNFVPVFPSINVRVGRVIVKDATGGSIYVNPRQINQLSALSDTEIVSPSADQALIYDGTGWKNKNLPIGSGAAVFEYFQTTSSSFPANLALARTPQVVAETTYTSPAVTLATSPKLIKTFQSPALQTTVIPAGVWTFDYWGNTSLGSTAGIQFEVYASSTLGVSTLLFRTPTSSMTTAVTGYNTESIQPAFNINATDVLVTKVLATQTLTTARTVTFYIGGMARYSHFETPIGGKHNDLAGLQGGASNDYYHLTAAQIAGMVTLSGNNNWSGLNTFSNTTTLAQTVVSSTGVGTAMLNFIGSAVNNWGASGWIGPFVDASNVFGIGTVGSDPIHFFIAGVRKMALGSSALTLGVNLVPATDALYSLGDTAYRWLVGYFATNIYVGSTTALGTTGLNSDGGFTINMLNFTGDGATLPAGTLVEPAQTLEYGDNVNSFYSKWVINGASSTMYNFWWDRYTGWDTGIGNFVTTNTLYSAFPTSTANMVAQMRYVGNINNGSFYHFYEQNSSGISGEVAANQWFNNDVGAAGKYIAYPPPHSFKKATMSSQISIGAIAEEVIATSTVAVTTHGSVGPCKLNTNQHACYGAYVYAGSDLSGGVIDVDTNCLSAKPAPAQDTQVGWIWGNSTTSEKCFFQQR